MNYKRKTMIDYRSIIQRLKMGEGQRAIHRSTGIHRSIIRSIQHLAEKYGWLSPGLFMPSNQDIFQALNESQPSKNHLLEPYDADFERWLAEGMDVTVMQRLLAEKCSSSISTIRRYLKRRFPEQEKPVMIRQTNPGKQMDVDFGELGLFQDEDGVSKRIWLFSGRLRHSRKAYREVVLNQKAATFFSCHIHAFEAFGGVPNDVVIDNLKAAVNKSTIDNAAIQQSYQQMAEHYGFVISPCLPRTPQHKGGVERDIQYVKRSFLPWFRELHGKNAKVKDLVVALKIWERDVDDVHLIYGVDRTPLEIFHAEEKNHLKPLPSERWQITAWSQCEVRRDWRIMVDNAYYSVPYRLIGKTVQICVTAQMVRIFYDHQEEAVHPKAKQRWDYQRKTEHTPPLKEDVLQCSREGLLIQAEKLGPYTAEFCAALLSHPSIDKLRPVRCVIRLALQYPKERLEKACKRALEYKTLSYESVKNILIKQLEDRENQEGKIISFPTPCRFARDFNDYKIPEGNQSPQFLQGISRHGNAMLGVWGGNMADQIMDEENQHKEKQDE